jgi:hypothetical protein
LFVRPLRARIKVALVPETFPEFFGFARPEPMDVWYLLKKRVRIAVNLIGQCTNFINEIIADGVDSF